MSLQPFVYQLRDALVESGIATPEQGERFIRAAEYAQQEVERDWVKDAEERIERHRALPWWKKVVKHP